MVRGRDLIVSVGFDALDGVVGVIVEFIKHHLVELVIDRHRLLAGEQSFWFAVFQLFEPNVIPNFINTVTFFGVGVQNFCQEMSAVLRKELGDFEITC